MRLETRIKKNMKIIKDQALNLMSETLSTLKAKENETKEEQIKRLERARMLLKGAMHLVGRI